MKKQITGLIILLCGFALNVSAAQSVVEPYAHLESIQESSVSVQDFAFALSAARKVNNQLRIETELRDDVEGWTELAEVKRGHDTLSVYKHYFAQAKAQSGEILYECSSRDCGQSNVWANDVFNESVLYGKDRTQYYFAARYERDQGIWIQTLYTVERGNGRVYVYQQYLRLKNASKEAESQQLTPYSNAGLQQLFVIDVPSDGSLSFVPELEQVEKVIDYARLNERSVIYVIGHQVSGYTSVQEALDRSAGMAKVVADLLSHKGIEVDRLHYQGVGPLVPVRGDERSISRVEVLFFRQ